MERSQRELASREDGTCTFEGEQVQVMAYSTNSARDAANEMARELGTIAVLGDRWTVRPA